ncbi:MAG: WGR domain-containing protein [bacterium]|nr:WGR domain-containing protein [bacterium]
MAEEKTYLEYSSDSSTEHKFYEVTVDGTKMTVRYGRIGTDGQKQEKELATPEKAKAEATKKLNAKKKKGYAEAVKGERKKRSITRRTIESKKSTAKSSPILWKFNTGHSAFGIFISPGECWIGNEEGRVFVLTPEGEMIREFKLPDGVKCIVSDGDWLYAGCDDGNVYDLTGKVPYVAYRISENVDIYWLDIADAVLGVSDKNGGVHVFNHEDESQWEKKGKGDAGWMVRCDEVGVFHGHSKGVTMYDWEDGDKIWEKKTEGAVLFGWQDDATVYAGTSARKVFQFSKQGEQLKECSCDGAVFSCAAADDGKYIFAGDNHSSIYCFDEEGKRLWKLATGCGSAFSMQYLNERLYIVTTTGALACIDASESAIKAAMEGVLPKTRDIKAAAAVNVPVVPTVLQTTSEREGKVVLTCVKEGSHLRVRVVSSGYQSDWNVQFPKGLREEGCTYAVDEIRESARGGFYRIYGEIKKLQE